MSKNITSLEINGNVFTGGSSSSGSDSLTACTQEIVNGTNIVTINPNVDSNFYVEINQNSSLQVGRLSSGTCKTLNLAIKGNGHMLTLAGMVRSADGSSINLSKLTNFIDYLQLFTFNGGQWWVLTDAVKKYYSVDYSNSETPNDSWTVQLTFDQGSAFNLGSMRIYDYNTGLPYYGINDSSSYSSHPPMSYYKDSSRYGVLTLDHTRNDLSTKSDYYWYNNSTLANGQLKNIETDFLSNFKAFDGSTQKSSTGSSARNSLSHSQVTILELFIYLFGTYDVQKTFTPTGTNTIKLQVTVPNTYPIGRVTFVTDATSATVSLMYDDRIVKEQTFVGSGSRTIEFIA